MQNWKSNIQISWVLVAWIAGLFILIWALIVLHNIFSEERDDALSEISARQSVLRHFVLQSIQQNLSNRLKYAQVNAHDLVRDSLKNDTQLLLVNEGEQILPRPVEYQQQSISSSIQLYGSLKKAQPLDLLIETGSKWEQRLHLLSSFMLAIEDGDSEEIKWAFRDIREHRINSNISADRELPFMIALIENFLERSEPNLTLLQGVIRDGSIVEQENNIFGLQRLLLTNRNLFTQSEFKFFRDKILVLSKQVNVRYQDFLQQSESQSKKIDIQRIDSASIDIEGQWYVEPVGGEELLGIAVDLNAVIDTIKNEMVLLKLIQNSDEITFAKNTMGFLPLDELQIAVVSGRWQKLNKEIEERYWLKSSLLILCAMLFLTIVLMAYIIQHRKQRYLILKSDFVSTVSHELRTPLASLRLLAETLERRWKTNHDVNDYPKRIVKVIDDLSLLVENILSFNRLSKGLWRPKLAPVQIAEVFTAVLHEYKQNSDIEISADISQLVEADTLADGELLKILFRNLLSNSIKYNESAKTTVNLKLSTKHPLSFTYQDNGIGVDKSKWLAIFDDFTRVQSKEKDSTPGTGLGLAICKRIMDLHEGEIIVLDSNKNGTTFSISFSKQRRYVV